MQYPLMQVQLHAKYPLFDSQSDRWFTFSYAILGTIAGFVLKAGIKEQI